LKHESFCYKQNTSNASIFWATGMLAVAVIYI